MIKIMNCYKCQSVNSEKAKFCDQCGTNIFRLNSSEAKNAIIDIIHEFTNRIPDMQQNAMSCFNIFNTFKLQSYPKSFKNMNTLINDYLSFHITSNPSNWKIHIFGYGNNKLKKHVFVVKRLFDYFFSEFLLKYNNIDTNDTSVYIYNIDPIFNERLFPSNMKKYHEEMIEKINRLNLNNVFPVLVKIKYNKNEESNNKFEEEHYYQQLFILNPEDIENIFPMLKGTNWFSARFKDQAYPWCSFKYFIDEYIPYLSYKCIKYYIKSTVSDDEKSIIGPSYPDIEKSIIRPLPKE